MNYKQIRQGDKTMKEKLFLLLQTTDDGADIRVGSILKVD